MRGFLSSCVVVLLLMGCAPTYPKGSFLIYPDHPYTLSSGDRLRITVFGQSDLTNSYSIDGSGQVAFPLIGHVSAKGVTTDMLAAELETRLQKGGFLRQPRVSIEVEAYRPFFILGEVNTSGQYPFVNGMNVEKAIAIAGGFGPRASTSYVDLTRIVNGKSTTLSVRISEPLRPGDTIFVRERFF